MSHGADKYCVGLDTCSSGTIFKNKHMLSNIARGNHPLTLKGMTEYKEMLKYIGDTPLGKAYYCPRVTANGQLRDDGRILKMDLIQNQFLVRGQDDQVYVFKRHTRRGIYVCDVRIPRDTVLNDRETHTCTVEANMRKYTKREVEEAKAVGNMLRRMGYPGVRTAIETLRRGIVTGSKIPVNIFKRLVDIWGKPLGLLKGKARGYSKSPAIGDTDVNMNTEDEEREQSMGMDIAFIEGIPFLVSVAKPLTYVIVHEIRSKETSELEDKVKTRLR